MKISESVLHAAAHNWVLYSEHRKVAMNPAQAVDKSYRIKLWTTITKLK